MIEYIIRMITKDVGLKKYFCFEVVATQDAAERLGGRNVKMRGEQLAQRRLGEYMA